MKWFGHKQKVTKEAHIGGTEDDGQSQVSWFSRLTSGLSQTSQSLVSGLENALGVKATIDDDVIEALETELVWMEIQALKTFRICRRRHC